MPHQADRAHHSGQGARQGAPGSSSPTPQPHNPSSATAVRGVLRDPQALLDALDPDQRQVAEHLEGPMCVLAGAGTGKTRAITYRIAYGVATGAYQPGQVLAVTFTQRAAAEMRSRLADLGVPGAQARTFHSAALRQLDYFYPTAIGGQRPAVQEHKAPLVTAAARTLSLPSDRAVIRDLAAEIEWAKVTMTLPAAYAERARQEKREAPAGLDFDAVARLYETYEAMKTESNVIDFEDVLLCMVGILRSREDIAAQIRGQYKHFVVDEYQDVSPLQHRLLQLWMGPRRSQLCVVGDVSQTIYSFTGATPRFLSGFAQEFPGARTVRLTRDYRSTPQVVSLANNVLSRARSGLRTGMPESAVQLVAQRPRGAAVRFESFEDDDAEAAGVVAQVKRLQQAGVPLKEIAVLYRTAAQAPVIEQALADAGIGRIVRGGAKFFERPEVRTAMQRLRAADATQRAALSGDLGEDVRAILEPLGWSQTPPTARGAVRERWDSLNALVELADSLAASRGATLEGLCTELAERAQALNAPSVDAVTLSTIHASKGLEWDAVMIIGVADGLLPISLAEGAEGIEEERRLLYVAVTRAREHLILSYARARSGGRGSRKPSRFLTGIWPSAADERPSPRKTAASGKTRAQAARDFEDEADAATLALFETLRQWRSAKAQERSVPAYTVFADTTLRIIAVAKPTTRPQLSAVHGVGAVKLNQYGEEILRIVQEAVEHPEAATTPQ